jgi:hypothetical protein
MSALLHTTELTPMECGVTGCGIPFAIPDALYRKANADHDIRFYCPNGHHIHFLGKTVAERAEERAAELERRLASREEDPRAERMRRDEERRRHAATKGQLTKARKRAEHHVDLRGAT